MAKEADESTGLEIDNSYHSVVNSWFGNDDSNKKKHVKDVTNEDRESGKSKKKRQSSGENHQDERSPKKSMSSLPSGLKKIAVNLSSFINEKLSKKMKKNKRKQDEKTQDETVVEKGKKTKHEDLDADSKTMAVSKLSKPAEEEPVEHSVESLKQRLEGTNLSQSARKRLKKRLNKMLNNTDGETRAAEVSEIAPTGNKNNNTSNGSETEKKSFSMKRKISDNEEISDKEEEISPKKRKKAKKRSKQKNIKKDNRPEHLKPPHLQKTEAKEKEDDDDDDVDDVDAGDVDDNDENMKSKSFTKILPLKKEDSSKKNITDNKPAKKKGGKLPLKTEDKKGKKLIQKPTIQRDDPHTIESLNERLKETDLTKSTRKRLMRRLINLKNEGKAPSAEKNKTDSKDKKVKLNGADGGKEAGADVKDSGKGEKKGGETNKVKKRKHQNKTDTPVTNDKSDQADTPSSSKKIKQTEEVKDVQINTPKKKKKQKSVKSEHN